MDPTDSLSYKSDTSVLFIREAARRGHTAYYCSKTGIRLKNGSISFTTQRIHCEDTPFRLDAPCELPDSEIDAVFIRTDPPFDDTYLLHTWLLDHLDPKVFVMNSPAGIRQVNEKLWATQFQSITPDTLVTSDRGDIESFLDTHQRIILKPINGYGGQSIFKVSKGDDNTAVIIETMTQNGCRACIAQAYIPAAEKGDKRILMLNAEPLGALLRVHSSEDFRNNFYSGGRAEKTKITESDLKILDALAPHLKALGLYFVGVDILGEYLVEVNVTSPTCLQEMNQLYGTNLEKKVLQFVESHCKT